MEYQITAYESYRLRYIMRFLDDCSLNAKALIQNEILMVTPIMCWNENTKSLERVDSVNVNGSSIQLNLEKGENDGGV